MSHKERVLEMMAGGDIFRSRDFDLAGIPRVVLKRMVAAGELEQPERGVYRMHGRNADETKMKAAEIAIRHPYGILCLMSAMRLHGMTDDMNSEWTVAVRRTSPVATAPWVRVVRWTLDDFHEVGVTSEEIAGVTVKLTDPARTVADVLRRANGLSDEVAFKAFAAFLRNGGEPEKVGRIARKLGFHRDVSRMVPFARQLVSEGAFQPFDPSAFEF
jgi:Predicted transcriptional regulator